MSLLHHHSLIKEVAGFVPLDADVLLKHTKDSASQYTKNTSTGYDGYAYRDINSIDNSEIRMQNPDKGIRRMIGFYNKDLVDVLTFNNFDYAVFTPVTNNYVVYERGVLKYTDVGIIDNNGIIRVKKITGAAEYYYNDVLKYTSVQDFNGAEFGCLVHENGLSIHNVYFKL